MSTPRFDPESNRLDHKPLCIGVGYLASFTVKYTEGSSDGTYTVYNLREVFKVGENLMKHTFDCQTLCLQIKAKMLLLKHVSSTSESYFSAPYNCLVNYSGCPRKHIILNGTNGEIVFYAYYYYYYYYYYRYNQICSWKIMANKGEQVKLVLKRVEFPHCSVSCSCGHLKIQNGTYADGATTTRMCEYLQGNVTIYSRVGHGLRIQAVTRDFWWFEFRASYTVISHKDTVSNGK